ncbi:MAG: prepilin-type N-terminal cleavage/methylation domain-containing protein [Myxococcota bacterium]
MRRREERGFTLVELVVSMGAGLLVTAAAFLLARNSAAFFQRESSVTAAQFGSLVGMTRLQSDLRRAAYLSSPHAAADPLLCGDSTVWPAGLQDLAGINIVEGGSVLTHALDHGLSTVNGLNPDSIVIGGTFDTTEQFAVDVITTAGGGGFTVQLQNDGAMARTSLAATQGAPGITQVFAQGRFLRIVDQEGRIGWGVITGTAEINGRFQVSVAATPELPTRNSQLTCGCEGFCTGALVNPVTRVRYDLRQINPQAVPGYRPLYNRGFDPALAQFHRGDNEVARTELIRVELDAENQEIDTTLELLTEFAVDLKFGLAREQLANPPPDLPVIERFAIGAADVYATTRTPTTAGTPELARSIQVRLSTRSDRADRDVGIPPTANGGLYRYSLGPNRGFARVRTLITDITLVNQRRFTQ